MSPLRGASVASRQAIGVEIAGGRVLAATGARPLGAVALAPGVVELGEVRDVEALACALRELLPRTRLGRPIRVGLVSPRLVARILEFPSVLPDDALAEAIRFGARDVLPADVEACRIAHVPLDGQDAATRRVLVTAVERVVADRLAEALDLAGLRRASIHAGAMAAAELADPVGAEVVLCVDALATATVVEDGRCAFFRTVPVAPGAGADLVAEVGASLDYYLRLPGARDITRLRLVGAGEDWPGLAERLRAETALEVVAGPVPDDALAAALARHPGPALAGAGDARRRSASPLRSAAAPIVAGAAVVAAAGGAGVAFAGHRVAEREDRLRAQSARVATLQARAQQLAPARAVATARDQAEAAIREVLDARFDWSRALGALAAATPRGSRASAVRGTVDTTVQIAAAGGGARSSLRASRPNPALEIAGCSPDNQQVARYVRRLGAMPGVTSVAIDQTASGAAAASGTCRGVAFDAVAFYERFSKPAAGSATGVPAAPPPKGAR